MFRLTRFTKDSFIFSLMILLPLAPVSQVSHAADATNGEQLFQKCIMCHGENGQGKESQNAPRIAGQFDWYIVTALKDFKSGARKNPAMMPYIKDLSESDFEDLAAYISSIELPKAESEEIHE